MIAENLGRRNQKTISQSSSRTSTDERNTSSKSVDLHLCPISSDRFSSTTKKQKTLQEFQQLKVNHEQLKTKNEHEVQEEILQLRQTNDVRPLVLCSPFRHFHWSMETHLGNHRETFIDHRSTRSLRNRSRWLSRKTSSKWNEKRSKTSPSSIHWARISPL